MSNINNMSSLTSLDLSHNYISGTLPSQLGYISEQLDEILLHLNYLSCDIPPSILQWKLSDNFKKLNILDGNLFSCPEPGLFAIQMSSDKSRGLEKANRENVEFYSCGGWRNINTYIHVLWI